MKAIKQYKYSLLICSVLFFSGGCDKDFEEINTNPYAVTEIDPALLFRRDLSRENGNIAASSRSDGIRPLRV